MENFNKRAGGNGPRMFTFQQVRRERVTYGEIYYAKCTYALANKSYRGSRDIQENYNHLGVERGLLKLSEMGRRMRQKDLKRILRADGRTQWCEDILSTVTRFPPLHAHTHFVW